MKLKFSYFLLLTLVVIHLFFLSRLVFFPYPELFVYPYLVSKGLLPYKEILDQHFPGLMFFPINFHTLGMITPQIARVWHFGVVVLTHIFLFVVARKIFKSEKWALLVNFLYLAWQPFFEGYVFWIDSFIPLLLLPAFYFGHLWLDSRKEGHLFLSGLFLGLALLFKQTAGPLIAFIFLLTFLQTVKLKKTLPLALGVLIPVFVLILYIVKLGIWSDFYYWTVTFNLTTFAQMGRKYPETSALVRAMPVFGLAIISWLIYYLKSKSRLLLWLGTFFFGSLIFAFARFDYIHLQPALPFALLVLVYVFLRIREKLQQKVYLGFIILTFGLIIPFFRIHKGDRIFFFGELERKVSAKVVELTEPQDRVFALGTMPHLYQMTNTLPSGHIFVFQFPWFMIEAENRILSGIINDPPKIVVRDRKATTGGMRLISYMKEIDNFIEKNYQIIEKVDQAEILVRK